MRVFELDVDGYTPKHSHPWPHINYVLKGKGTLRLDGIDHEVEEGSYAYVPGNIIHQFLNQGNELFSMICIVPEEGEQRNTRVKSFRNGYNTRTNSKRFMLFANMNLLLFVRKFEYCSQTKWVTGCVLVGQANRLAP